MTLVFISSLPPVETPLTRAARLHRARETETPFTPTVSLSIVERGTPTNDLPVQRSASPAACAELSRCSCPGPDSARRRVDAVVIRQPDSWFAFMTLPRMWGSTLFVPPTRTEWCGFLASVADPPLRPRRRTPIAFAERVGTRWITLADDSRRPELVDCEHRLRNRARRMTATTGGRGLAMLPWDGHAMAKR